MTTIEDKIRKLDYEDKAPDIKPTLKNTMFDFHPDKSKKFKLEHTKEFDRDFKDGKAKTFKEDTNIKMLGDSKYKHFTVSKATDPFEKLFGYKHTERPNRYLDGYYQFNMKGKDNTFYMKDNLLREEGHLTELEQRLQDQEEFMQQYFIHQENAKRIPTETETKFNEAEEARALTDVDNGKDAEQIKVEKAQRRQQIEEEVIDDIKAEVEDILEALEEQKQLPERNIVAINKRFNDFLDPKNRSPATRKGMVKLIQELKNNLGIKVKQITIPMKEDAITKAITDVKEKFNNYIEEQKNKVVTQIQKHIRRRINKSKVAKAGEEKLKALERQRGQMYGKAREEVDKVKAIISQNKPKTPEEKAREQEARARELASQGGLASTGRQRQLSGTNQTLPPPPPPIPTAPTAPTTGAQAEPPPAVSTDDAVWTDTDKHLEDLKSPMKTLLTELQSLNTPNSRVDAKYINKLNRVASLIEKVDSIKRDLRTKITSATKVEKAIEILNASLSYIERGSPQKHPREGVSTRGSTAVAGGGAVGGGHK